MSGRESSVMPELIQRIATGPKLSKDLTRDEARRGLGEILSERVHPAQSAIFLIALRMKRESDDENLGMLDALLAASKRVTADIPLLIDVSEPYDGFAKVLPVTAFLPALLAACGVPAVSHGAWQLGPKYGVTHAQVLAAADIAVDGSCDEARTCIEDPQIGWCYIDQSHACPALSALGELRHLMVKRTALSTLERVLAPMRACGRTHLLAGYVHTAYPRVYAALARAAGFDAATLVRGTEGGVVPSLRQPGQAYATSRDDDLNHVELNPTEVGVHQELRGVTATNDDRDPARCAAQVGLAALQGRPGAGRDALIYSAAIALWQAGQARSLTAAAESAREAIDSGAALARLHSARTRRH